MWYEDDSTIINACKFENKDTGIVFDIQYLDAIKPSNRTFKRDFTLERKESFDIAGISHHDYQDTLYLHETDYYNGKQLELKDEPSNKYDPNAIAIYLYGSKLGYIPRDDTDDVHSIMTLCEHYKATLDCSTMGWEKIDVFYLRPFHDTYSLPYQTDLDLKSSCSIPEYKKYRFFVKRSIGHAVTFQESYENNLIEICTDMNSIIGYIDDDFIRRQWRKGNDIAGFVEDVKIDDNLRSIEIKLRLLMNKSDINLNYKNSFKALEEFFGSFYDAGTYTISLADLIKVVPRKTRKLSAYEPLVKYLRDYHAITLNIIN